MTVLTLAACAHEREKFGLLKGPGIDLDATNIKEYTTAQNQVLQNFVILAGIDPQGRLPAYGSPAWTPVVQAGINYVDRQCRKYIDALFWWDRGRTTTRNQVNLVGTATAGTLGIIGAAAQPIALTAVAFGVTSASIDNLANSILYQVEPSGVRGIVDRTQAAYKEAIKGTQYTNRPDAVSAIGGYLALCLPETLEAEVNHAIAGARVETLAGRDSQAPTVTISTNPSVGTPIPFFPSGMPVTTPSERDMGRTPSTSKPSPGKVLETPPPKHKQRFPKSNESDEARKFIEDLITEARTGGGEKKGPILKGIQECKKKYTKLPPTNADLSTDPQYAGLRKQVMACLKQNKDIFPKP